MGQEEYDLEGLLGDVATGDARPTRPSIVTLVVGLLTYWIVAPDGPPRPEDDGPRGCVEYSGGSTDCPGG